MFLKIMSRLVKSPASFSKVALTSEIGSPMTPGGGSGASLLALEPPMLNGGKPGLDDETNSGLSGLSLWTPNCLKWSSLPPNEIDLFEATEIILRLLFVAVLLKSSGQMMGRLRHNEF